MGRRKGSLWGKKGSKSSSKKAALAPGSGVGSKNARKATTEGTTTSYGRYYDKLSSRGECDDLVLLENVSNEGIVEVSTKYRGRGFECVVTSGSRPSVGGVSCVMVDASHLSKLETHTYHIISYGGEGGPMPISLLHVLTKFGVR